MEVTRKISMEHGAKTIKLKQRELKQTIQQAEGGFNCFGRVMDTLPQWIGDDTLA